jgi:hypothetical protein
MKVLNKSSLFINTIKYLKPIQVYYRLYYFLLNNFFNKKISKTVFRERDLIHWISKTNMPSSYSEMQTTFVFLNKKHSFSNKINWNFDSYGKLWTYNLNYFDFLNQGELNVETGINLIYNFINEDNITTGKESYPISLRSINWIKFLSKNQVKNELIDTYLYGDYDILLNNLEFHILGNHLLENAFSLLFGAYYFQDEKLYTKAKKILFSQLNEQILNDGAHFELSPMYHQIMLFRILDCINLVELNTWKNREILLFLKEKASFMLSWLNEVTFKNGDIPIVNDSAKNIALTSNELFLYAKRIGLISKNLDLSDSGYRMFRNNNFELFVDVGNVGPDYQPGHVHSDTLSFILYLNNEPLFVDTGISTYEKNITRQKERQTSAHNTVVINNQDQTQVWGGFRVAKRAFVKKVKEGVDFVEAEHDGYKNIGVKHSRRFLIKKSAIIISDIIINNSNYSQTAYFHLHPSVKNFIIHDNSIIIENEITMIFTGTDIIINKKLYEYATEFNKTEKAVVFKITFKSNLETSIKL